MKEVLKNIKMRNVQRQMLSAKQTDGIFFICK